MSEANLETGATTIDGATSRISALLSPEPEAPTEAESVETVEQSTEPVEQPEAESEEPRYTVKVAGEEQEVSLEDLRKGYMMQSDYSKKTAEVSERKKALEQKEADLGQQFEQAKALVESEIQALDSDEMRELKSYDPEAYLKEVDRVQSRAKQLDDLQEKRNAEAAERQQDKAKTELELLERAIPDWIDLEVRKKEGTEALQHLESIGFTSDELASMTDHRMFVLARKAAMYDKISSQDLEGKRVNNPPKTQQPGTGTTKTAAEEKIKSTRSTLKQTGNMRDAAKVIKALMES